MTMHENKTEQEKALLVSVDTGEFDAEASIDELEELVYTAGAEVIGKVIQKKEVPEKATFVGVGKLAEIIAFCQSNEVDLLIFDSELSPSQQRNLEKLTNVRVIDRTMLILDIFALRARTAEGKLQVELAQLKYQLPRLAGQGTSLSRLGGGIGTRGPGETKLESDKRHIRRKIQKLEQELKALEKRREQMHKRRQKDMVQTVAIVGYTNAGKSTLMNALTDAGVLAENKLFATLDPTTRKFELPSGETVLLTDTVGFIRKLPHHLVNAFRSTLDEAVCADIIMILADASDPEYLSQLECTEQTLEELGAGEKPTLYVFNKCDRGTFDDPVIDRTKHREKVVHVSALTGEGCDKLADMLVEMINGGKARVTFKIPNSEAGALNRLYKDATVEEVDYGAEYITVVATVDAKTRGTLRKYDTNPPEKEEY